MLDTSMLAFLAAPFVASLILTGIHAYLGVHVVERGVIFVDLSLAQIAALGATIAILMPFSNGDPHAPVVYWISLAFTFIGAGVFSYLTKPFEARDVLPAIQAAVARHEELLAARRVIGDIQDPVDLEVTSSSGNVWPLRLRRRPDGTLDVTLHNVK